MKEKDVSKIRSFALVGHSHSGKTSLVDQIFFMSGDSDRLGKVDDGTSYSDYFDDERARKTTIHSKVMKLDKDGHEIFIMDTPGYNDFFGEVVGALAGVDCGLVVIDAVAGIQVRTTKVMRHLADKEQPTFILITKLDKEHSDFEKTLGAIREAFGTSCVPVNIPVGKDASFKSVVSVLEESCSNASVKDTYDMYREIFMESFAETDDELTMKYLEGEKFTSEELHAGVKKAIQQRKLIPVLCGSAEKAVGIKELLDFVCEYMPSPKLFSPFKSADGKDERKPIITEPFSAQVFKIVSDPYIGQLTYLRVKSGILTTDHDIYNVSTRSKERVNNVYSFKGKEQKQIHEAFAGEIVAIAKLKNTHISNTFADADKVIEYPEIVFPNPTTYMAVHPKNEGEEEKIATGLHQTALEDPTLKVDRNVETKELIIGGLGDLHLDVKLDVLRKKYGAEVNLTVPKVAYRETIKGLAEGHCKHKKQSGGRGQFADVYMKIEPLERGQGFEFVDEIVGGAIPKGFIPAVEKGVVGAMEEGVVAGCKVQDVRVRLYFGSYHTVDSSELAFKIAGSKAFKEAMEKAQPYLLEPYVNVEVVVNDEYMGQVTGEVNVKRGRIMGIESAGPGLQCIKAQAPLAEMYRFPTELRSITGGSAAFSMEYSHYEEVPAMVAKKISEAYKRHEEEE
ncbi:MAG: elongation factor G [Candidatus Auribacterota bacterium]|jgi:elongation factor G|uniref:Elongation factor G n=1 Tax=Candidatus Auribacter fodinae TaxID=2093366 RepID=A0A3A4R3A1_9BACT|nr:MAG: elongation factor G [Candidatus Auribacter fodinae]